ncbi:MAG: hypothetical protein ACRD4U_01870 [Candidatus Acidiferrales bacterium]
MDLNIYSLALWGVISAANYLYVQKIAPIVMNTAARLQAPIDPIMRAHIRIVNSASSWGLAFLALVILTMLGLRLWKRNPLDFVKSGKILAVVTWLALVGTFAGVFAGFVQQILQVPLFPKGQ